MNFRIFPGVVVKTVLAGGLFGFASPAHGGDRAFHPEVYVPLSYQWGDRTELSGDGAEFEIDDAFLGGIGMGFNINDHFNVNFEMVFSETDIAFHGPLGRLTQDALLFNGRLNLDFYPLSGPITPIITAGIGWDYFEADVPGAPPVFVCVPGHYGWWCDYSEARYGEAAFTWNAGVGIRWDIGSNLFAKLLYNPHWAIYSDTEDIMQFDAVTLHIGFRF